MIANTHTRSAEVAVALARYVGYPVIASLSHRELKRDLRLEPLDIVLFVLSFEDGDGVPFCFDGLAHATTADDLIHVVARWLEQSDRDERLAALEDEPRSSVFRAASSPH